MRHLMLAAFAAVALAGPASAGQCPALAAQIEEALAATDAADLAPETVTGAEALLAAGMKLHEVGEHEASEAALTAAMEMLGIG